MRIAFRSASVIASDKAMNIAEWFKEEPEEAKKRLIFNKRNQKFHWFRVQSYPQIKF